MLLFLKGNSWGYDLIVEYLINFGKVLDLMLSIEK